MGGLSTVKRTRTLAPLALLCVVLGCEQDRARAISAPRERSQAVQSTASATAPSPATTASAAAVARKPRRALCAGQKPEQRGLPKKRVSQARVNDFAALPEQFTPMPAGYTWVNFWAAWCAPCKEEIPRLVRWDRELGRRGRKFRLAFVSLDDDERQLQQFLESSSELRATYWLKEGKEREEWMAAAGLELDPELPIHLLIGPDGRIHCKVQGAVEDADFEDLERLLGG